MEGETIATYPDGEGRGAVHLGRRTSAQRPLKPANREFQKVGSMVLCLEEQGDGAAPTILSGTPLLCDEI